MKLILSRKGFDSSWGGSPSPILPDGSMMSLPIPQRHSGVTYGSLQLNDGLSYLDTMRQLGISTVRCGSKNVPLNEGTEAHLDPDLVQEIRARLPGWRAAYGQVNGALSHLKTQKVGPGDIFLSWHERLQLSQPGQTRSFWRLPQAFDPRFTKAPLTYHARRRWELHHDHVVLHSAPIGQEFVVEINDGIERWLVDLLTGADRAGS